jgi:FkbM family methyltransferase
MKCYLEYCRYCYWHGAKNCVDNSFFHNADGFVEVEGMKFPQLKGKVIGDFWCEFPDLLLPYIIELHGKKYCFEQIEPLMVEGPYELNDNIAVHEGDVVIDCGANIGLFSAIASDKGAMVYAFEPDGDIIEEYLSKTKEFHNSIDIVPYALSDKCGETFFEKGLKTLGAGHLTNDSQQADFAVKTTTLDQFVAEYGITKVDYIKADIEGAERYMLKGAVNVLKKFAPRLSICTYHLPDDKTVLENIVKSANPDYVVEHRY